jgi:hypothetical protein
MDRAAYRDAVLRFVIDRIEQEATQSGERLSAEQRFLLENLPRSAGVSLATSFPENPKLAPRNVNYERLCDLAKLAYREDVRQNRKPLAWELASAVTLFHNDPMWSLLHYAGVKGHRPWWDPFLLIFGALLWIAIVLPTMFIIGVGEEPLTAVKWSEGALVIVPSTVLMVWASRRIQGWQLDHEIDRCRAELISNNDE